MNTFLGNLANALSRTSEETQRIGDSTSVRAKFVLVAALVVPVFVLFVPLLAIEADSWNAGRPALPLKAEAWRVVYGPSPESCDELVEDTAGCLANTNNKALWTSPFTRANADHRSRIDALQGSEFWLGLVFDAKTLFEARKLEANQFILGSIAGTYRVWIDGELIVEGNYANTRLPVIVPVSMERLATSRPLRLAVQVVHDVGSPVPDLLGGTLGEGFATVSQSRFYTYKTLFWNETRPWFFFGADLLIATLFFFLWSGTRRKQEYFYVALYAAVHAFIELSAIGIVNRRLGFGATSTVAMVLTAYEALFGMLLGLSFARTRRAVFSFGLPLGLVAPWLVALGVSHPGARLAVTHALAHGFAPLAYGVGLAVCLVQAAHLAGLRKPGTRLPVRVNRLVLFATGLVALAVIRAGVGAGPIGSLATFLTLLYLCVIVMREYREQEMLVAKTPVSDFHRRPVMPDRLEGAVLVVDIKRSEWLFREGARMGDSGKLTNTCLSHMWTAVSDNGGFVLMTEGDQLRAFFPREKSGSPVGQALRAVDQMSETLRLVAQQFLSQGVMPADALLVFRGGLATGAIRPIWHESGQVRVPAWIAASPAAENPIVAATELMERESHLVDLDRGTHVLAREAEVSAAPEHRDAFTRAESSGGRVLVYRPRPLSSGTARASA